MYFCCTLCLPKCVNLKRIVKICPLSGAACYKVCSCLRNSTYSNVLGQGIIALTQGTLLANGFWIFGIPDLYFGAL